MKEQIHRSSESEHHSANQGRQVSDLREAETSKQIGHRSDFFYESGWHNENRKALKIQAALEVGKEDDMHEQEANHVADKVMQMPDNEHGKQMLNESSLAISKMSGGDGSGIVATQLVEQGISKSKGSGQSLPANTEQELSGKMGVDLREVKIHTGNNAIEMNKEIGAKAFTHGNDIYFNEGQYNPTSYQGKHLLTHELTHTVQQGSAVQRKIQRQTVKKESKIKASSISPMHHQFLITVALDIYDSAKANGASTNGALLVLAQAALESGWGQSAMQYQDFNLFGVMGLPSKRKTAHGNVKDYSNAGGYRGAITDYFKKIDATWPTYQDLIKKADFTSDDIDKALNTGDSYPTDADRMKGKYAYNADLDKAGKNHYGTKLLEQKEYITSSLLNSMIYQVGQNNARLSQIEATLASVGVLTEKGVTDLSNEKDTLTKQSTRLTKVKTEINATQ